MDTITYSALLRSLEGFDAWLRSLGVTPRSDDRIHEAFKIVRLADEASRRGNETGIYTDIRPEHWFPLIEALEASEIFRTFEKDSSPALSSALKRALSGPMLPTDESPKNSDGRNVWYELALAAEWKRRGAMVSIGEPDLQLVRDNMTFLVACKRPAKQESIHANIRDAIAQLEENLDKAPEGTYGVAAISLTRILNPGDKVFFGDLNDLGALVEKEMEGHRRHLRSVDDPRICCAIFEVTTPSNFDRGVDLSRASFAVAQELKPSEGSKILRDHVEEMRKRADTAFVI
jgi:hypothetical protein